MNRKFTHRTPAIIAALMLAGIVAAAALAPAQAKETRKAQFHGAIALDRELGRTGFAVDRPTARSAAVEALNQCGGGRCEVVLAFKSSCGALANSSRQWAASTGATRQEAESKALRRCASDTCSIAVWACTH